MKRHTLRHLSGALGSVLLLVLTLLLVLGGTQSTAQAQQARAQQLLEQSLTRAAVSCYAIEGHYPESLDYLTEHYGVVIDERRFVVDYQVFASNLMPQIHVFPY